jgi:hypothetical protein
MRDNEQQIYPSYYAVIPATVRYNENITPNAKLLYGEITALSNKFGYCIATNIYFAKLYNTKEITVIRWINSLKEEEFIYTELTSNRNRKIFINKGNKNDTLNNTSYRSIKDTPKKGSVNVVKINSFTRKCIDTWNSISYVRHHKKENSKIYLKISKYVDEMIKGNFDIDKAFDKDWMDRHKITSKYLGRRFSRRQILSGIENVSLMFKEGYFPQEKNSLPKSLPRLMYNSRTGTSLFISSIIKKPEPMLRKRNVVDKNPVYTGMFKEYLRIENIDARDLIKLIKGIESILEFRSGIPKRSLNLSDQVERKFGNNLSTCKTYITWLKNQDWLEPHVSSINSTSKVFSRFIKETEKQLYGNKLR